MKITLHTGKEGQPRIIYEVNVNGEVYKIGTQHKLYNLRYKMIQRCYHSKPSEYKAYQGKRIQVCDEWRNNPESFFEWCLNNGWKEGLQLDRIDSNGNYEPSNIQFSTISENSRRAIIGKYGENARNVKLNDQKVIEIKKMFAKNITNYKIAKQFGLAQSTIANIRNNRSWSHIK